MGSEGVKTTKSAIKNSQETLRDRERDNLLEVLFLCLSRAEKMVVFIHPRLTPGLVARYVLCLGLK